MGNPTVIPGRTILSVATDRLVEVFNRLVEIALAKADKPTAKVSPRLMWIVLEHLVQVCVQACYRGVVITLVKDTGDASFCAKEINSDAAKAVNNCPVVLGFADVLVRTPPVRKPSLTVRHGVFRVQPDGLVEVCDRRVEFVDAKVGIPTVIVGRTVFRFQLDGLAEVCDRLVVPAFAKVDGGTNNVRRGEIGFEPDDIGAKGD